MRKWECTILCAIAFFGGFLTGQMKQHTITQQWRARTHALARVGMRHTIVFHPEHTDVVEYYFDIAKEANPGEELR